MSTAKPKLRIPLFVTRFRSKKQILSSTTVFALLIAICLYTNFPSFSAWYGPIDDHDFLRISNPSGLIGVLQNIPQYFLENGRLGDIGNTSRYLPVYYFLRFSVISIFGEDPGFLYFLRVLSQSFCAFLVYLICKGTSAATRFQKNLVELIAIITAILALSASGWIDISTRLGPSEMELSIGICLTIFGLFNLANKQLCETKSGDGYFLVLLLGVSVASGSKENGLVSVIALSYILIVKRSWVKQKKWRVLLAFVSVIIPTAVTFNVISVVASGSDVYGNQRNSLTIVGAAIERVQNPHFYIIMGSAIFVALNYFRTKKVRGHGATVVMFFLVVLFISEGVFYSNFFLPLRYELLSNLALCLCFGITLTDFIGSKPTLFKRLNLGISLVAAAILSLGLFIFEPYSNFRAQFRQSEANSDYTNNWKSQIQPLSQASLSQPSTPIVIYEQSSETDYERIASTVRFLRFLGVNNNVFLIVLERQNGANDLLSFLWNASLSGSERWDIQPLTMLNRSQNTLCVSFFDDPRITGLGSGFGLEAEVTCSAFYVISP